MNRRQLLAGFGAAAAGSGAALGTGAFTTAQANRDVGVSVTGDASAYVALNSQSEYAIQTPNGLKLDFSQTVSGGGSGVGKNSAYVVDPIFELRNQGTQTVEITPQFEEQFFDKDGDLIANNKSTDTSEYGANNPPENAEFFIAVYNKYYEDTVKLSTGNSTDWYAVVNAGDNVPESLTTEISINADAI
jgi:hypothetical protein